MGCSSSSDAQVPIRCRRSSLYRMDHSESSSTSVNLETSVLNTVLKENGKNLELDLQDEYEHKQFLSTIVAGKNGASYRRLPDINNVMISLNEINDDISNKNLISVIRKQFPANISCLTFTGQACKARPLKSYIDALKHAKTKVTTEFCAKMCAIDGNTLSTLFAANCNTQTISFFGVTFSELDKFKIEPCTYYSIKELSFAYCKGLDSTKGSFATILGAIGKVMDLSTNLKSIELIDNKLGSEEDVKKALVSANLSKVKLSFDQDFICQENEPAQNIISDTYDLHNSFDNDEADEDYDEHEDEDYDEDEDDEDDEDY